MRVGGGGVTLIKEFEGFPHGGRPYRDIVGVQ
jgi:GH24 family phage-related lysozyme (muramidase)